MMMAYTSPSNIKEIMRKLPSSITDQDITYHIERADALIDGKLGGVFATPFYPVPKLIEHISTDLAIFFLAESLFSSNSPNLDEYQVKRYDRAMKMLEEIAIGDLAIGVSPKSGQEAGFASTNDEEPIFTLDEPEW
jgi:phage gp36-like protein